MEVEGTVFEDIPEAVILKASLIAASRLIGQTVGSVPVTDRVT